MERIKEIKQTIAKCVEQIIDSESQTEKEVMAWMIKLLVDELKQTYIK